MRDPIKKLRELAQKSVDDTEFIQRVMEWVTFYITTPELKGWTKAHLREFYRRVREGR